MPQYKIYQTDYWLHKNHVFVSDLSYVHGIIQIIAYSYHMNCVKIYCHHPLSYLVQFEFMMIIGLQQPQIYPLERCCCMF